MVNRLTLLQVPVGTRVRIQAFADNKGLDRKLRQYGLFAGDEARLLRLAPLGGPLLIEINGREIALGRGVAAAVLVETL
jgi:ferrous iron transport protein A